MVKKPPASAGDVNSISGQEDPLEEGIATHSSILAWQIPWTEFGVAELDMTWKSTNSNKESHSAKRDRLTYKKVTPGQRTQTVCWLVGKALGNFDCCSDPSPTKSILMARLSTPHEMHGQDIYR